MMRGRTLLLLIGILVVLAGIGFWFESSRHRATHVSEETVFRGLDTELVDRIRINWKGKETVLEKKDGRWLVATEGSRPAEPKYVSDILERLPKYYSDEVVSENPANQSLFQVDSSGVEVWVHQKGKEIGHFFVGKPGPDFMSTYVRPAASNRVILVPDYLPHLFQRSDTWRARILFELDENDIRKYEYASPTRGAVVIAKDEAGVWRLEAPDTGRVDMAKVSLPLSSFATLKASGFADTVSVAAAGIEPDTSRVSATLADGSVHTLVIGLPTAMNRTYARKQGSEEIVTIPRGVVNTMMPPAGLLKAAGGVEVQEPGTISLR